MAPWLILLGVLFTGLMAVRQVRVNHISKAQIDKLTDLRTRMASFLLRSYAFRKIPNRNLTNEAQEKQRIRIDEERDEAMSNLYTILLTLNPKLPDQKSLMDSLNKFLQESKKTDPDTAELIKLENLIKEQFNDVYQKEWNEIRSFFKLIICPKKQR